jgi:uncharacterized protein
MDNPAQHDDTHAEADAHSRDPKHAPAHAPTHERFEGERTLMRIHIGESDRWHGKPLYEAIVELLRRQKFSGATVLRGVAGYGSSSVLHTDKILRLSQDLPIVIEVVESPERINQILPQLDEMIGGGLLTLEKVHVILYRSSK